MNPNNAILLIQAADKLSNAISNEDWGMVKSASNDLDEVVSNPNELPIYPPEWVMRCMQILRPRMEKALEYLAQIGVPEAQRYFNDRANHVVTMWTLSFCAILGAQINKKDGRRSILLEAHMDQVCAQERMRPGSTSRSPLQP